MSDLLFSPKFKTFLKYDDATVEMLEGVTHAGKTTVGVFKYIMQCAKSPKKLHVMAAKTTGIAEKNLINKDLGVKDIFGTLVEYNGAGTSQEKIPHLVLHTADGDKTIYVLGYGDVTKWQLALGGQYGCVYIDEINTANIDFVREIAMRCDYLMGTLNPDDPSLPVYEEYVNHCRPLKAYEHDAPEQIARELKELPKPGWVHWFFNFDDNKALSAEKRQSIIDAVPPGTKLYKNKILGERGRATGLVFPNFDRAKHVINDPERYHPDNNDAEYYYWYSVGVDTAYSSKSPDTIALSFIGITNLGTCVVLDERVYNNAELLTPVAPSDTVVNLVAFMDRNCKRWGLCRSAFIDSADQATLTECAKYKRAHTECWYNFTPAYKKVKIVDRIKLQLGWIHKGSFLISAECPVYISELERYSWREDKDNEPEDGNDHMINSVQYAWIPFQDKIRGED